MSQPQVTPLPIQRALFPVRDYDLAATLSSGQAFRWNFQHGTWEGILTGRWVRLTADASSITAQTAAPTLDWNWLTDYLQLGLDLSAVLATFPDDEPMRAAVGSSRGLRLLRQEPWECLASFILSSTKQIVQIRQIVALLCERFGEPISTGDSLVVPPNPSPHPSGERAGVRGVELETFGLLTPALSSFGGGEGEKRRRLADEPVSVAPAALPAFSFPAAAQLARVTEADLRACKMGFRAPYLLATARVVAAGKIDLERLRQLPVEVARLELMNLPGVGRKIADCVLLFAYGFQTAFPVDVWVMKALQQLYFPKRRASDKRLRHFAETHFGPNAGYAQQYLFHYMRTKSNLARGTP